MNNETISNSDDIIDIRNVIARVEALQEEREALVDTSQEANAAYMGAREDDVIQTLLEQRDAAVAALTEWDGENDEELKHLVALLDECRGNGGDEQWEGDWYPVTLIRDSYFKTYAQELADDIGAIDANATWPNTCIDWDRAARELRMDYTSVSFDGVDYWVR